MTAEVNKSEIICHQCGKLTRGNKGKKYCSSVCRSRASRPLTGPYIQLPTIHLSQCRYCGVIFRPKSPRYDTYCSKGCSSRHHQDLAREERVPAPRFCQVLYGNCGLCNKLFATNMPTQRYCSRECARQVAYSRRYIPAAQGNPFVTKQCPECGKEFSINTHVTMSIYCSKRCGKRVGKRNRRAMKRKGFVETVHLDVLIERDFGLCQICLSPVNQSAIAPAPDSPSIDHIIPLTLGGKHSYDNCQLAHFHCNSLKSGNVWD